MKVNIDAHPLRIACPSCRKDLGITVGQAKGHRAHTCRHCRTVVNIDAKELDAAIQQLNKSLADIGRTLGKFGKR